MEARQYLEVIERLDSLIENKALELAQLRDLSISLGAPADDGSGIRATGVSDRIGNISIRIVDLEREISALVEKKQQRLDVIEAAPDFLQYTVLYKRYVQCKKLTTISYEEGYSYQYIVEVHQKALHYVQERTKNLYKPI